MKKIGIFYGTTTGNTALVAKKIAKELGVSDEDVKNVASAAPSDLGDYEAVLLGCSTWGDGDMQGDMHDFIDGASTLMLRGKKIAYFGCGDDSMSDTFCNGVGEMYRRMAATEAQPIGIYNTYGFEFNHTGAEVDGKIVGLLIDNTNHEDLTDTKIKEWCEELKGEI